MTATGYTGMTTTYQNPELKAKVKRQRLRAIACITRYAGYRCYNLPSADQRRFAEEWRLMGLNEEDIEYLHDAAPNDQGRLYSIMNSRLCSAFISCLVSLVLTFSNK
jgi:hypothetical protein